MQEELVKVIFHSHINLHPMTLLLLCAFQMTTFPALHAPNMIQIRVSLLFLLMCIMMIILGMPHFQTPIHVVSNMAASSTLFNVHCLTISRLMTHLVTFEAEFSIAVKAIMSVLAAQNATQSLAFIWTFPRHVPKFFTISTLYRRVRLVVVSADLCLHSLVQIIII